MGGKSSNKNQEDRPWRNLARIKLNLQLLFFFPFLFFCLSLLSIYSDCERNIERNYENNNGKKERFSIIWYKPVQKKYKRPEKC